MNAYELADELDACFTKADWEYVDDCVSMLRQQADRIAELEKDLHMIERHYDQLDKDVDSKPVAWVDEDILLMSKPDGLTFTANADKPADDGRTTWIPLYTHPIRQLSDEDIDICAYRTGMWCDGTPDEWDLEAIRNFARAIIKEITE